VEIAENGPGGKKRPDLCLECDQADCVSLEQHKIGKGSSKISGVSELCDVTRRVPHGTRGVQEKIGPQIGFFFELLDVVAVCASPDFPVNVTEGIAGHVRPVFRKFYGEAVVRTSVEAGDESFDHESGHEVEP